MKFTRQENIAGLVIARQTDDYDGYEEIGPIALTSNQSDKEVDFDSDKDLIKGFAVECVGAIKIETNATDATGGNTINVPAGGMSWMEGDVLPCPFTQDVTKLYITDMGGAANSVKIRVLRDATP